MTLPISFLDPSTFQYAYGTYTLGHFYIDFAVNLVKLLIYMYPQPLAVQEFNSVFVVYLVITLWHCCRSKRKNAFYLHPGIFFLFKLLNGGL